MQNKPVVILAAITGGTQRDREGAVVPTTPTEIREALEAVEVCPALALSLADD